jgi:hypothetical protein
VRADLALKALCRKGERQYTGRYTAHTSKRVLTAPSAEDNEEIINTVLSKGLESMMTDPGLLDFLKSPPSLTLPLEGGRKGCGLSTSPRRRSGE